MEVLIPRRVGDGDECVQFASRCDDSCRNCHSSDLSTLAKDKEGHIVDDYSAGEHKMSEECRKNMKVAANKRTLHLFEN